MVLALPAGGGKKIPEAMLEVNQCLRNTDRDVQMAYYGRGPYKLKKEYQHLRKGDDKDMPAFAIESPEEIIANMNHALGKTGEVPDVAQPSASIITRDPPVKEAAKWLFENEKFELAPKSGVWLVGDYGENLSKEQKVVKLNPASCTCRAKVMCPHMLCVLKASGVRPDYEMYDSERSDKGKTKKSGATYIPGRKVVSK